jgi:hypothetical protein
MNQRSKKARPYYGSALRVVVVLAAAALVVTACTYHDPFGGRWEFDPRPANPEQEPQDPDDLTPACEPEQIGTVEVDGVTYEVWDFNCDGVADFVRGPDGTWHRVIRAAQRIAARASFACAFAQAAPSPGYDIDLDHGFEPPLEFDFGDWSAPEWISGYGLDGEPGSPLESEILDVRFDTDTWHAEVVVPWSTRFHIPDILAYGLNYEVYVLLAESGPAFLVVRLGGDVVDVINYVLAMTESGSSTLETVDPDTGTTWTIDADGNSGIASVFMDGVLVEQVPLD